jgi:hypothetical protein
VLQFDNVVVYQKTDDAAQQQHPPAPAFKVIARGTLLLQTSTTDPNDSRMVMRHKGLKVVVNMKIQGKYTYASQKFTAKQGSASSSSPSFGQIGFVGCNNAKDGARLFLLKAAPEEETAKPLHHALERLAARDG